MSDNSRWLRATESEIRLMMRRVGGYDIEAAVINRSNADHCAAAALEIESQETELIELRSKLSRISAVVDKQALDEGLWFEARTAPEGYLQEQLRRLHRVIEEPQ